MDHEKPPLTEDDLVEYLIQTPDFFDRHAQVLAKVELRHPHSNRAVSLQERQAVMLREKIHALEVRMLQMIHHGNENQIIASRVNRWACAMLAAKDDAIANVLVSQLKHIFSVPHVVMRAWELADAFAALDVAQVVTEDQKAYVTSLDGPCCGLDDGFDPSLWLGAQTSDIASAALLPLRLQKGARPFGLLVLASPDPQRFHAGMATDFLEDMSDMVVAAMSRLLATTAQH
jgi:uncharacterized protein